MSTFVIAVLPYLALSLIVTALVLFLLGAFAIIPGAPKKWVELGDAIRERRPILSPGLPANLEPVFYVAVIALAPRPGPSDRFEHVVVMVGLESVAMGAAASGRSASLVYDMGNRPASTESAADELADAPLMGT